MFGWHASRVLRAVRPRPDGHARQRPDALAASAVPLGDVSRTAATVARPLAYTRGMALDLPVTPPVEPMLAKAVDGLPEGDGWLYEPKWDGFRAIVFRDGDEVYTQSRDLKPLDRYFPELADPLRAALPKRCRPRRGGRHRARRRAGFRGAAAADPPRRVACEHARRRVAGELRRVGPPGARRRGPARCPAGRPTRPASKPR